MGITLRVPDLIRDLTLVLSLTFLASPASAWDFSPLPICTLSAPVEGGEVQVTYDPDLNIYEIRLSFKDGRTWVPSPDFEIAFLGERSNTIGTNRHVIARDGTSLSVTDSGFGNVLDGLEFNSVAEARAGEVTMAIPLDGAAEPVQAFRACGEAALS